MSDQLPTPTVPAGSDEETAKAILIDMIRSFGETNIAEDCRLVDAADYLRDKVDERIRYLNLAHQQGAENTVFVRKELARVRADLQRAEKDRDDNHKAWCEAKEGWAQCAIGAQDGYERMRREHDERVAEIEELTAQLQTELQRNTVLRDEMEKEVQRTADAYSEMAEFESIRNGDLVTALEQFINSCTPHPTEHPSLCAAWNRAKSAIKGMLPIQGESRCQAVASNGEGEVPTSAPASPAMPLSGNLAGEGGEMERIVSELEAAHQYDLPDLKGPQPLP